ncbi:DUF6286 domain-containing protein [Streptomyces sp. ME01-24h]|nr:DUF6286 domain-containing protein [Streptomyces sp. ME19-03-3]MDX3353546.1 DUF6286 domain-containing protein [Streptomyces sp. ME01-24h]
MSGPHPASSPPPAPAPPLPPPSGSRPRRLWSARRVPAAVTAAVLAVVAGVLLYDIAAVRAGRPGAAWRRIIEAELATRPLDDPWILAGASAAVVLGLWLLVLAVTPGLRGVLVMRRTGRSPVRAGLDCHVAELTLRDRAVEVSGVRSARVTVTRRTATVRAVVAFGRTEAVRADLAEALAEAVEQLGLARPLGIVLHVRRMGGG